MIITASSLKGIFETRSSSGDEIANVNFLYEDIVHVLQNTIDSRINSATDRPGHVLERRFAKFSEITQYNGHCAVQGHSRSPILVFPLFPSLPSLPSFFTLISLSHCLETARHIRVLGRSVGRKRTFSAFPSQGRCPMSLNVVYISNKIYW